MDIKEKILVALGLNKDEEVKLAWQSKSEDGTIFVSTAEELELIGKVWRKEYKT